MTTNDSEAAQESSEDSGVHTDEEWKRQVKAEDAAMDASLKAEASTAKTDESDQPEATAAPSEESPDAPETAQAMPPATFEIMVSMFSTQAMVSLGVIPNPATGKAETIPDLAKHFIDLLGVLETKTAGNLEADEKTLLESSLHQLRMAYVEATKR